MFYNRMMSVLCLSSFAAGAYAGAYVGVGVGSDFVRLSQQSHVWQPGTFNVFNDAQLSATGVQGSVFGGLYRTFNRMYMGAEFNASLSSVKNTSRNDEFLNRSFSETRLTMNNHFGVSILPGFKYSPDTLFYARLGYENAEFKSKTTDVSLQNLSKRIGGLRYGLGAAHDIGRKFGLRVDYSLIDYENIHFRTFDKVSNTTKITTTTPFQQLVELGLVYTLY
ncbi:hypothetical protein Lgee_1470 [Legionella geestiana]|uniref:Uncharacterized protein n=1 Tax=Legionella geestiana TaxID=45065 RepID=A0A0W0TT30_9GAMM|nr:outer membrane beta-barrel protein [Legionella geestiana]KTC98781.1 hypothetical protein Lgee_1470 [Legionella geestiana]QBS12788.1 hypothetical protein E4T54_08535 [Legionella geestiana]QDQ39494.1 porin family protein [Legionella geestiana]STX54736.1 Uncharacterised protein [Legionella geestiana]